MRARTVYLIPLYSTGALRRGRFAIDGQEAQCSTSFFRGYNAGCLFGFRPRSTDFSSAGGPASPGLRYIRRNVPRFVLRHQVGRRTAVPVVLVVHIRRERVSRSDLQDEASVVGVFRDGPVCRRWIAATA
jgi:hypothetical protein